MASPTVPIVLPNPEVRERPTRRRFTLAEKQRILTAAAACTERGALGALPNSHGYAATVPGSPAPSSNKRPPSTTTWTRICLTCRLPG